LILSHDFQERFLEREALGRELEDVDIRANEMAQDFRQTLHGIGGELQAIILYLRGTGPLREAGKNFRAEIVGANVNMDFAVGRRAEIARTDDLTLLDEDHGIASNFDFTEQMGIEEDRGAALALVTDNIADQVTAHGIEAGGGFVEEDQFGLMDEGLRQADALHHAFGKAAEASIAMRGEADQIDVGRNALAQLGGSKPAEAGVQREKLGGGEPVVKTEVFGKEADFTANFDVGERMAKNLRLAAGGPDEAE